MKRFFIFTLYISIMLIMTSNAYADTFTILQSSINVTSLGSNTNYGGNQIIIDKVSSSFGDPTFDAQPLIRYNIGSDSYSYYSQIIGGYFPNHYNSLITWNNNSMGLYPSKIDCAWNNYCLNPNTYWKSSTLEIYIARNYNANTPYTSPRSNFTVYLRDNINNRWNKITDFYDGSDGLLFDGQIYLMSTMKPMYNLLGITKRTSIIFGYEPQHLNITDYGWYHPTSYSAFNWATSRQEGIVWKVNQRTAQSTTYFGQGRILYETTYPTGRAYNIDLFASSNARYIQSAWFEGLSGATSTYYMTLNDPSTDIKIYKIEGMTLNTSTNDATPISYEDIITSSPSCLFIKTLNDIQITDIDCKDKNECLFGGHYKESTTFIPVIIKYDGENCALGEITGSPTNSTIEAVIYEQNTDTYYIGGQKLFAKYRYTTLIGEEAEYVPICTNNQTLCLKPFFDSQNNILCNLDDTVPCSNECVNTYNPETNTTIGECVTVSEVCENTCFIIGERKCYSTTAYETCQLQGDGCYSFGTPISCTSGQYCLNGFCYSYDSGGGGVGNVTLIDYPPFTIKVDDSYTLETDGQTTTIDPSQNRIDINSINLVATQGYAIGGISTIQNETYATYICNYSQKTLLNYTDPVMYNSLYSLAFNPLTVGFIEFSLNPNITPTTLMSMTLEGGTNQIIANLTMINNVTSEDLCLYRNYQGSIQEIYCYDLTYDNFAPPKIRITPDFNTKTYTVKFEQTVTSSNSPSKRIIYTEPLFFEDNTVTNMNTLYVYPDSNHTFFVPNVITVQTPTIPEYNLIINNVFGFITCAYYTSGCRTFRAYHSLKPVNAYDNYKDLTVCVTLDYTEQIITQQTVGFIDDLFGGKKDYGLAIIILFIIFLVSAIFIGGLIPDSLTMAVGISTILTVGMAIMLAFLGYLPIWILIIFLIIASGIVTMIIKGVLSG